MNEIFDQLADWCISNEYSGYDPFDGLNSRIFQALPFKHSRLCRLAWIQFFKRSPINFRKIALVPKGKNPKGLALSALAWLEIYRENKSEKAEIQTKYLLNEVINSAIRNPESAISWGYNFDWQGRAFFAPIGTPTVVPTSFVAKAFIEAYQTFGDENYLKIARNVCEFIIRDLKRTHETADEICFSYSPIDETRVFNASLLACETLACVSKITDEIELKKLAIRGANYVVKRQKADGSWSYGDENYQSWADNFHTAFNLMSLKRIALAGETDKFDNSIHRGYEFWIKRTVFPNIFTIKSFLRIVTHPLRRLSVFANLEMLNWLKRLRIGLLKTFGTNVDILFISRNDFIRFEFRICVGRILGCFTLWRNFPFQHRKRKINLHHRIHHKFFAFPIFLQRESKRYFRRRL
jgi:hypothetical protein